MLNWILFLSQGLPSTYNKDLQVTASLLKTGTGQDTRGGGEGRRGEEGRGEEGGEGRREEKTRLIGLRVCHLNSTQLTHQLMSRHQWRQCQLPYQLTSRHHANISRRHVRQCQLTYKMTSRHHASISHVTSTSRSRHFSFSCFHVLGRQGAFVWRVWYATRAPASVNRDSGYSKGEFVISRCVY